MAGKAKSAGMKGMLSTRPSVYRGKAPHHSPRHFLPSSSSFVPPPSSSQQHADVTSDHSAARSQADGGGREYEGSLVAENQARGAAGLQVASSQTQDRWTSRALPTAPSLERATLDVLTVDGVPVIAVAKTVKGFELAQR